MTPEQEAALRAQMAKARDEADITASPTVIDLDTPEEEPPVNWADPPLPSQVGPGKALKEWLASHYHRQEDPALTQRHEAATESMNNFSDRAGQAVRPFMGMAPGGPIVPMVLNHVDNKVKQAGSDEKSKDLSDQEELYKKALARAKAIQQAKDHQARVEQDRDQAVAEGHSGYRVERPLFGLPR